VLAAGWASKTGNFSLLPNGVTVANVILFSKCFVGVLSSPFFSGFSIHSFLVSWLFIGQWALGRLLIIFVFFVSSSLLRYWVFNHYFNIAACQAGGNFVAKTVFWDWCAWPTILIILGWWVKSVRKRLWVPVFRRIWFCRSR